jgi:hypothetical protein
MLLVRYQDLLLLLQVTLEDILLGLLRHLPCSNSCSAPTHASNANSSDGDEERDK